VTEPIILARAIHFAASVLASGTMSFMVLVAEPAFADSRHDTRALTDFGRCCSTMIRVALAVAVLSGLAWLALLSADIYGASVVAVCLHGGVWSVLTGTRFGIISLSRLVLAILLALLVAWPPARYLQLAAAAAFLAGLAFIGHAGATPGSTGQLHLAADIVHLLAAGCWLGGLPALALLLTMAGSLVAARAAARFSMLGILSVGALAATGLINSWMSLAGPRDFLDTGYGRALALKVGLFAAMLGIAAVNRFYLTPRLSTSRAQRALAGNSLAETGLGLGVLLLVGLLGTMAPTAHPVLPPPDIPEDAAFVHIHTSEAMADVTVEPGRTGLTNATIRVLREDSSEFPADDVRLTADPPAPAVQPIDRAAVRQADGTWQVKSLNFGLPGNWTVRIVVGQKGRKPIVLDAPIVIER
jgi:putative copper resistance protein D